MRAQLVSTPNRGATLTGLAGRIVRGYWHAFWDRRARRATVEILHSLDDRTLRDIGICRSEIGSVVYGRHGDRRHCYEETWRWYAGH